MGVKTHKDLEVWNKSIDLVTFVYKVTNTFPKEELYGLTTQIRRSAVSIPSNIAEGAARNHEKEFLQFLYIALGSSAELDTQIIIADKLEYINKEDFCKLNIELSTIAKMLQGLIRSKK